jgi:cytochrome P450
MVTPCSSQSYGSNPLNNLSVSSPYDAQSSSSASIPKARLIPAKNHPRSEQIRRISEIRNCGLGRTFDCCRDVYLFYSVLRVIVWIVGAIETTSTTIRLLKSRGRGFQEHAGVGYFLRSESCPGSYKSIMPLRALSISAYVVSNPYIAGKILKPHRFQEGKDAVITLSTSFQALTDLLGPDSLMTAPLVPYQKLRKFANPFFSHVGVRRHVDVLQNYAEAQISAWVMKGQGSEVTISTDLLDFSRRVILKSFFGIEDIGDAILPAIETILPITTNRLLGVPNFVKKAVYDNAQAVIARATDEIIRQIEGGRFTGSNTSFMAEMINAQTPEGESEFTEGEIRSMCKLLLFAGQDTTGNVLNALIYELGRQPKLQQHLYEDFQKYPSILEFVTESKVLILFLCEIERLYPSVFGINRRAAQDLIIELDEKQGNEIQEFFIPEGSDLFTLLTYMNRDIRRWPDEPGEYKPFRDMAGNRRGSFVFGGGANPCLGRSFATLMMKIFIAQLISSYSWTTQNPESVDFFSNLTLRLMEPIRITLEKRS